MGVRRNSSRWERLEIAIQNGTGKNYLKSKNLTSESNFFNRKSRHHQTRSFSSNKHSNKTVSRPKTASTVRTRTYLPACPYLSSQEFENLFEAKCLDLRIADTEDQENRFASYCSSNLKNRIFQFSELGISTNTASVIGRILKNSQSFSYLNLSKNHLKDEGSTIVLKSLRDSLSISHVDLSSNDISEKGMEVCLNQLIVNESISSLNLSSQGQVHKNRLGTAGCKTLSKVLRENKVLSILNLGGTGITPEGLGYLILGMSVNTTLISLNIENNAIGSKTFEQLMKGISSSEIRYLNLTYNKLGDGCCEHIGKLLSFGYGQFCTLTNLNLSENQITSKGAEFLFKALRNNTQLNQLNLSKNKLSKGLSKEFLEFLYENSTLSILILNNCSIYKESLVGLSEGLSRNFGIKELHLANNFIQDNGCEEIAIGLLKNKVLEFLDLSSNKIKTAGGMSLCKSIFTHATLKQLILKHNFIQDDCGKTLAEIARKNSNFIGIDLDFNPVSVKQYKEIKEYLKKNSDFQKKLEVPRLKKAINKIYQDNSILEDFHFKLVSLNKEKKVIESTVKEKGFKLDQLRELENQQLKELVDKFNELKAKNFKLSSELNQISNDTYVISKKLMKINKEKIINESSLQLKIKDIEIRTLEEKSKENLEKKLVEELEKKQKNKEKCLLELNNQFVVASALKQNEEEKLKFLMKSMVHKTTCLHNLKKKVAKGLPKSQEIPVKTSDEEIPLIAVRNSRRCTSTHIN